jgi:transposase-like protein
MLVELRVGEQRYRVVWEVLEGASVTEVARRFNVSRQSVHSWLTRYAAEGGLGGLGDRSSRPHGCPPTMLIMSRRYRNSFVKRVVELDSRRVVMLSGLQAARRAPSTLSKSRRWSLGCIHPSSPRFGCGAVSAWPRAGGHLGQRAKMRRPCGWHAPSS